MSLSTKRCDSISINEIDMGMNANTELNITLFVQISQVPVPDLLLRLFEDVS